MLAKGTNDLSEAVPLLARLAVKSQPTIAIRPSTPEAHGEDFHAQLTLRGRIRRKATSPLLADRFIAWDVLPLIAAGLSRSILAAGLPNDAPLDYLVNSSKNSGTPSVRSTICATISLGNALPPVRCATISARCRGGRRLKVSNHMWTVEPSWCELWSKDEDHQHPQCRHAVYEQIERLSSGGAAPVRSAPAADPRHFGASL